MKDVNYGDDKKLRASISIVRAAPIGGFSEDAQKWILDGFGVFKSEPSYDIGYSFALWPESRMYKRWFDFPDLGKKGWAIILRVWDAGSNERNPGVYEKFPGWVPPEREQEADLWIAFFNQEIRARLREAGQTPKEPDPAHGAIPPPAPPGPVPVPPRHPSAAISSLIPAGLARAQGQPQPPPSPLPTAKLRK
ncbi:MAG: hypothetical protein KA201_03455 [Kofleriaceae bacterium]|nr:hypothetical protein [Kofleriaceae bacterium]